MIIKERLKERYRDKDTEVKRSAREDKRKWVDELAQEAEMAAENGRSKKMYSITKKLKTRARKQRMEKLLEKTRYKQKC